MTEFYTPEEVTELTKAQDTEGWNRPRTNEELASFVKHKLGRLALTDEFELATVEELEFIA